MHQESGTSPDNVKSVSSICLAPTKNDAAPVPGNLWDNITKTTDKLFSIAYTPSGTMNSRWYLVQADVKITASDLMLDLVEGKYYCTFLAKYPFDAKNSDYCSFYWSDWYCYLRDLASDNILFGDRVYSTRTLYLITRSIFNGVIVSS